MRHVVVVLNEVPNFDNDHTWRRTVQHDGLQWSLFIYTKLQSIPASEHFIT